MNKKVLRSLAQQSFSFKSIDEKKVTRIIAQLKKTEARTYLQMLYLIVQQHTVQVHAPIAIDSSTEKKLQLTFPDKKITYILDKNLLAGLRIVDNDMLYDFTLDAKLDSFIRRSYDFND